MTSTSSYSLADAKTYCASVGAGWRVPTIKELLTLGYPPRPAFIDATWFPNAPTLNFWSSSRDSQGGALVANRGQVLQVADFPTEQTMVRCVHN
jgi:hypothetical protein